MPWARSQVSTGFHGDAAWRLAPTRAVVKTRVPGGSGSRPLGQTRRRRDEPFVFPLEFWVDSRQGQVVVLDEPQPPVDLLQEVTGTLAATPALPQAQCGIGEAVIIVRALGMPHSLSIQWLMRSVNHGVIPPRPHKQSGVQGVTSTVASSRTRWSSQGCLSSTALLCTRPRGRVPGFPRMCRTERRRCKLACFHYGQGQRRPQSGFALFFPSKLLSLRVSEVS